MTNQIVIDPVTRIEGHLRIEAQVDAGVVSKAYSSGTMFRGMELILQGRDPREAWIWAQRICGVCTTVHAHTSVYAVEDALGIEIPPNARLIRNLIAGAQHIQDHVIHFYHLHALDWVDVTGALTADPAATSKLAQSISPWGKSSEQYFTGIKARVKKLVDSGQLSLFASGYWGHPAYKLPPEADLMAVAHYLEALEWQREVIKIHAQVYVPDVKAVASFYPEWWSLGAGHKNYLCYGGLQGGNRTEEAKFGFNRGIVVGGDLTKVVPLDQTKITEAIAHSYYDYAGGDSAALHPWDGETKPHYTGPTPPYDAINTDAKYSWLKSPRYDGMPMEVGPLARMLVAYASGNKRVQDLVNGALTELKLQPAALFSTLGRVAARALETVYLLDMMDGWLNELAGNMDSGDLRIHDGAKWDPATWPDTAEGWGFHEAPRGALGHWIKIKNKKIENYQAVVPSTWNAGPRDAQGQTGPYEASLEGTPVADPEKPLELLRTIHSFDPCLACAVHVVDATGRERVRVEVR